MKAKDFCNCDHARLYQLAIESALACLREYESEGHVDMLDQAYKRLQDSLDECAEAERAYSNG